MTATAPKAKRTARRESRSIGSQVLCILQLASPAEVSFLSVELQQLCPNALLHIPEEYLLCVAIRPHPANTHSQTFNVTKQKGTDLAISLQPWRMTSWKRTPAVWWRSLSRPGCACRHLALPAAGLAHRSLQLS